MDNLEYRYKVKFSYDFNGKLIEVGHDNIISAVIDYDYDIKNMPVILLTVNADRNLIDDMILHCNDKLVTFTIHKYLINTDIEVNELYIKDEFKYFLPSNINTRKDLDYEDDTKKTEDYYNRITIGLLRKDLLDNNKILINEVVDKAGLIDVITYHLQYRKLLVEPMNRTIVKDLMIPPMTSISSFIRFIDNIYPLYNTKYRLFYDFDKTYLVSSSGNGVKSIDETYNDVIITVNNATDRDSTVQGMSISKTSACYLFQSHITDIRYIENRSGKESFNRIIAIDEKGNKNISVINNTNDNKTTLERITTGDLSRADNIKENIENSDFLVTISKTGLDTSILTINKVYIIKNNNILSDKDGKYLLVRKREMYIKEDTNYLLCNLLSFRRINS